MFVGPGGVIASVLRTSRSPTLLEESQVKGGTSVLQSNKHNYPASDVNGGAGTINPDSDVHGGAGNICRSPTAEAVFRAAVDKRGLSDELEIDSAGTIDYHQASTFNGQSILVHHT